nr:SlyX family protein [Oceanococcus sp. HetDA_MAG_MS8]
MSLSISEQEQRLVDLESRLAFADDTVRSLNEIVAKQQLSLDALVKQVQQLHRQIEGLRTEVAATGSNDDERPPHY